jgi:hypothetical protein
MLLLMMQGCGSQCMLACVLTGSSGALRCFKLAKRLPSKALQLAALLQQEIVSAATYLASVTRTMVIAHSSAVKQALQLLDAHLNGFVRLHRCL